MWINEQTQGVFTLHTDIRYECWKEGKQLPGILTDEILAENGYALVTQVPVPFDWITEKLVARPPVKGDTGWTQTFDVVPLEPAIIANNRNIVEVQRVEGIKAQLARGNAEIIEAMLEGNQELIDAWKLKAAQLKAQL
jgi:hypothetical protein